MPLWLIATPLAFIPRGEFCGSQRWRQLKHWSKFCCLDVNWLSAWLVLWPRSDSPSISLCNCVYASPQNTISHRITLRVSDLWQVTCRRVTSSPWDFVQINRNILLNASGVIFPIHPLFYGICEPSDGWWWGLPGWYLKLDIKPLPKRECKCMHLEILHPRSVLHATVRTRGVECYAEWCIIWCQPSFLEWANCNLQSEDIKC